MAIEERIGQLEQRIEDLENNTQTKMLMLALGILAAILITLART